MRLSAHRLRVETGRWSGLLRNARLCSCPVNEIQDERHVLTTCPYTEHLRRAAISKIAYPDIISCPDSAQQF